MSSPLSFPGNTLRVILVVEHCMKVGTALAEHFHDPATHYVMRATSSSQAFQITRFLIPDLFIFNHWLPDISGRALYERLYARTAFQRVPVIFLDGRTATNRPEMRQQMHALPRPFALEELVHMIHSLVDAEGSPLS